MKTFIQFIAEAQTVKKFSDTILKNWKKIPFVLRSSIWKQSSIWNHIFPDSEETIAFHITDKTGFENLLKRQGRKNAVSAFNKVYNGGDNLERHILHGIETEGQVLLKMKGNSTGEFGFDAYTIRTDSGHRTIFLNDVEWADFIIHLPKKDRNTLVDLRKFLHKTLETMVRIKNPAQMDGKEKYKFIKDYLDATEKYVKQNYKAISSAFKSEIEHTSNNYNEVVLEYGKIIKAYIMNDSFKNYDFEGTAEIAKNNNIPYQLISQQELRYLLEKDSDLEIK